MHFALRLQSGGKLLISGPVLMDAIGETGIARIREMPGFCREPDCAKYFTEHAKAFWIFWRAGDVARKQLLDQGLCAPLAWTETTPGAGFVSIERDPDQVNIDVCLSPSSGSAAPEETPSPSASQGTGDAPQVTTGNRAPTDSAAPWMPTPELANVYRLNGTNRNGSDYRGIVAITEKSGRFSLICWNGKKVFKGTGSIAGNTLAVKWSDGIRVTFAIGADGALDGQYAKGGAKETLTPFAKTSPDMALVEGRYRVAGKGPDGNSYTGTVEITKEGKGYRLRWDADGAQFDGPGKLADNILTADWKRDTPVVYALTADGSLRGLWDSGDGEETATPETANPASSEGSAAVDKAP